MIREKKQYYLFSNDGENERVITQELQRVINEMECVGGEIEFAAGKYVLSTVFLKSNITFVINEGVQLLGSMDFNDYAEDERVSFPLYQDASHSFFHCSMFVGENCKNITFKGNGTIDMRSVWDTENKRNMVNRGAKCIALKNCEGVKIEGISIYNATDLAIYFAGCEDVDIDFVKMRVYIDGISPDNSKNVRIRNCEIETGDDGIVFKSSYNLNRLDECRDILVENCVVKSRCNAIKIGTETNGGFKDMVIRNIDIRETRLGGICIESTDGADIENIFISDITMKNVGTPIFIFLGDRLRGPEGTKVGSIENITIQNVKAEGPYVPYNIVEWNYHSYVARDTEQYPWYYTPPKDLSKEECRQAPNGAWQLASNICGLRQKYIKNITLRNLDLYMDGGMSEKFNVTVPECSKAYPDVHIYGQILPSNEPHSKILPASGLYCRYIDGLVLENVRIKNYRRDTRETFLFDNVNDLRLVETR